MWAQTPPALGAGSQASPLGEPSHLSPPFHELLTLTERNGLTPQVVALGVPGTNGHAVSHQAVAGVAAKVDRTSGLGAGLAQKEAVEWSPGQAAVGSWTTRGGSGEHGQAGRQVHPRPLALPSFPHFLSWPLPGPPHGGYCSEAKEKRKTTKHVAWSSTVQAAKLRPPKPFGSQEAQETGPGGGGSSSV